MDPKPPIIDPSDSPQVVELKRQLYWAQLKVHVLEERLRLQRIKKYGPASERFSGEQLELLEQEPGVSRQEVKAESEREPLPRREQPKRERRHPGRQQLPEHLPRKERVIPCAPETCQCPHCGKPTEVIGYEESEQLDVEPAAYYVLVVKREKRACRCCQEGVTTAVVPPRIIEKGLVSDRVVIDTVVSKYCDHLPLYRQSAILERETGVEIGRATMDGWVMRVGELLMPVAGAIGKELLAGSYIQADETPVDVQMHDGRGSNHQAYLWQYGRPGGSVIFDFQMGRGRNGPKHFLGDFGGVLQTDGYSAYEKVGGPKMAHAACWAHARRKFVEAHRVSPEEKLAKEIVDMIDDLFAIDAEAREASCDVAARDVLRQQRAPAVLDAIKQKIEAVRKQALPSVSWGRPARTHSGSGGS